MKQSNLVFTFCVLVGINTVNLYDRQVLTAVREQIRKEWDLSTASSGCRERHSSSLTRSSSQDFL